MMAKAGAPAHLYPRLSVASLAGRLGRGNADGFGE
jgi:hypothetical protein